MPDVVDAESPPTQSPVARPWWAPLTLVAFVGLVVVNNVGTAFSTKWVNTEPERLILFSARVRHLVLVAGGGIDWWSYAGIAAARLGLAYAVCHLIGRGFGRTVLVWFGRYLGVTAQQIQSLLQTFHRAEWFVIPFFVGSNIVAAITGISRVHLPRLIALVSLGIGVRLAFWWMIADIADDEVDSVLRFLDRYQRPALIISIVLTVVAVGFNLRRGRGFELDS